MRQPLLMSCAGRLLAAGWLALAAAGCNNDRIKIEISSQTRIPPHPVVIFFADGCDITRLRAMLAEGRLPHIQRVFVKGGVTVENAVTSIPSLTYPNCTSGLTGVFPGHHGIMGNRWFDRHSLVFKDYMQLSTYRSVNQDFFNPTLYELLDDSFTINIQHHTRRGVSYTMDNWLGIWGNWLLGRYMVVDRNVALNVEHAARVANRVGEWPQVLMTYYPGVDEMGHEFGPESPGYAEALINLDQAVGLVTLALDAAGMKDAFYVLISDHGMSTIQQHFNLAAWIEKQRGQRLRTVSLTSELPDDYEGRLHELRKADVVLSVEADRLAAIHLRSRAGDWSSPSYEEALEFVEQRPSLLELPAVELAVLLQAPGRVRVMSRAGTAVVERRVRDGVKEYRVVAEEGDPIHLSASPELKALAGDWHESRVWLKASCAARYPDFVPQVVELFDSPRVGNVMLFAADGWDFDERFPGGHGSILRRDMHIPIMFAGGGLPRGATLDCARLVDVMPTILGLLGKADRLQRVSVLDGVDMSGELRGAAVSRPAVALDR